MRLGGARQTLLNIIGKGLQAELKSIRPECKEPEKEKECEGQKSNGLQGSEKERKTRKNFQKV